MTSTLKKILDKHLIHSNDQNYTFFPEVHTYTTNFLVNFLTWFHILKSRVNYHLLWEPGESTNVWKPK